jgi:hypothetical protein
MTRNQQPVLDMHVSKELPGVIPTYHFNDKNIKGNTNGVYDGADVIIMDKGSRTSWTRYMIRSMLQRSSPYTMVHEKPLQEGEKCDNIRRHGKLYCIDGKLEYNSVEGKIVAEGIYKGGSFPGIQEHERKMRQHSQLTYRRYLQQMIYALEREGILKIGGHKNRYQSR